MIVLVYPYLHITNYLTYAFKSILYHYVIARSVVDLKSYRLGMLINYHHQRMMKLQFRKYPTIDTNYI